MSFETIQTHKQLELGHIQSTYRPRHHRLYPSNRHILFPIGHHSIPQHVHYTWSSRFLSAGRHFLKQKGYDYS